MIELTPSDAPHVIAMRASGRVDEKDLQRVIDTIEDLKKTQPRISLYAELDEMRWMTFTAFLRDLGYGLTQVGEMDRFYRAAIVTDKQWMKHIVRLDNRLFREFETRTFPIRDKEAAWTWVRHQPDAPSAESIKN